VEWEKGSSCGEGMGKCWGRMRGLSFEWVALYYRKSESAGERNIMKMRFIAVPNKKELTFEKLNVYR
jgi:hypothetical protein